MTRFRISIDIDKPLDTVIKAYQNPDNIIHWTTDLEKFEIIKGGPDIVGSLARLHYAQKGKSYIMVDELIYCEPGKKYISKVSGDALAAEVVTTFHPSGNQTVIEMTWTGRGKIFLLKILLPFFRGKIVRLARKDLEKFKKLVETKGIVFSE